VRRVLGPEDIQWHRYPAVARESWAKRWLEGQVLLGLAPNTIDAYARGVQDFLTHCEQRQVNATRATKAEIAHYLGELRRRPSPHGRNVVRLESGAGLSNATLQQRLTSIRLCFDHLIEEGLRQDHPVGRGRYTPGKAFGGKRERGLLPRFKKLPWIPTDDQWKALLAVARTEPIRNRCMLGFAYDAGLRRQELCLLESQDVDPAHRLVRVRAETTKGGRDRVVPYSAVTGELFQAYLSHRRTLGQGRGLLFLSESRRNRAAPITLWTWSKVIRSIANRADLPQFSTHTLRHLCLTDLARAGWDLHEIARFAGHRNPETTQQYLHLSGSDLAHRLAQGMQQIHAWRMQTLAAALLAKEETQC